MAEIIDGKKVALDIKNQIAEDVEKIKQQGEKTPHLAAILVGDNGASKTYVNNKVKACEYVGFESTLIKLSEKTTEKELLIKINELNQNSVIDGYIVQLPLPSHIDERRILLSIDPKKDVDGFHPANFGRMALEMSSFIPATPYGILELIKAYNIQTEGKNVVVIGRSNIVGRPISLLLGQKRYPGDATVTMIHSHTKNISSITQKADIIITALGIPNFLKADMVKENCTVIDVGITRINDTSRPKGYRIVGDVDFNQVSKKVAYITPVPGGVGPMTIVMLLKNTLETRKF